MTARSHANSSNMESTLLLVAGVAILAVAAATWAGAALAAKITGHAVPAFAAEAIVAAITHPRDLDDAWGQPMPPSGLVWTITAGLLAAAATIVWVTWRLLGTSGTAEVHRLPGTATTTQIRRAASARALLKRARHLRPSLRKPAPDDVGFRLGRARGVPVYASCEDSTIVLGPPRSGKGLHIVVGAILDAPGAVLTTSTRPDNLAITLNTRSRTGPIAVFDPQQLAPGIDAGLRWSPVRGCDNPQTAMIRARGLATATGLTGSGAGVENAAYWQGQTESVLRGLLHAAALDDRSARDLYRWSLDPVQAAEATRIMQHSSRAASGWADALDAVISMDERTRSNIWSGVRQALAALADPRVLDAVTPGRSEQFDPEAFITERGTLYLLGTSTGAGASAGLVAALVEDMLETARRVAARSPGARLDPPLSAILDEIGNLAPLPSLPALMAEGGGTGITTTAVLQSLAQARSAWGEHHANTIWDAAIAKVILGGGSNAKDLHDLAALIGERDDETTSMSRGHDGTRSTSTNLRRVPIMDTGHLRTLPFRTAVLMLRSAPPIILQMMPWNDRVDAAHLERDRRQVEAIMANSAPQLADPQH
ncbi:type IV secretory system conjugative DNA transfer family protein [Phytoactinopolyspora halotolerans]|uniref:Type IV secretory system conjugative DNA transfer family protein n=1 Tax=Phytoactinopolyspora halotolerans TaxID=1981512 RepID=A0A6L9S6V2_9ACTN|nr:TraM recognition domain-containing protein [Phytoactinopolyspora halotolerans]NEE01195.1 type IV secretory system conjugative DNA transfer family protein [Phytoactinopolyspora halotolerans]